MRHKHFLRRILATGEVHRVPFDASHFSAAGVSYAPMMGMPILEAFQLINKWNVTQDQQSYVYGLE